MTVVAPFPAETSASGAFVRQEYTMCWLEARLAQQHYLVGDQLTEADIRLFPTLVRFDSV
jgi:putative glutathione S-transferase